jgi:hypothetical protein
MQGLWIQVSRFRGSGFKDFGLDWTKLMGIWLLVTELRYHMDLFVMSVNL